MEALGFAHRRGGDHALLRMREGLTPKNAASTAQIGELVLFDRPTALRDAVRDRRV